MNKRKIAVFVEGQTELIFVREFLLQWFQYESTMIGFECYSLLKEDFCDYPYRFGDEDSENYYLIVNVGNDNSVLSRIRTRMKQMVNGNYQSVIGLRDMYCDKYVEESKRTIKDDLNKEFIQAAQEVINEMDRGDLVHFHFAIMEVEAWLLGMPEFLLSLDEKFTLQYVKEQLDIDLSQDPEETLFHPAKELGTIFSDAGKTYDKHETNIWSIMSKLNRDNYISLINSGKCATFKGFVESLLRMSENVGIK